MTDLLGPGAFGAARAEAARPAISPSNIGADTFAKDCTSPTSTDGTENRAGLFNAILPQLRRAIRGGQVTENNSDDEMLARAVRSQRMNWLTVGGTANDLTLAPSPAFGSLADLVGVPLHFVAGAAANTGAMTLVVSGLTAKAVTWMDGTALAAGDLPAGNLAVLIYDGTAYRLRYCLSPTQVRALLTSTSGGAPAYRYLGSTYVSTAGSGSVTPPAGATKARVKQWGGGGGSTASAAGQSVNGAGGGEFVEHWMSVAGAVSYTIGAGGAAAAYGTTGGAGGDTTIGTVVAKGGGGSSYSAIGVGGTAGSNGSGTVVQRVSGALGGVYQANSGGLGGTAALGGPGGATANGGNATDGIAPGGGAGGPGTGGWTGKVGAAGAALFDWYA